MRLLWLTEEMHESARMAYGRLRSLTFTERCVLSTMPKLNIAVKTGKWPQPSCSWGTSAAAQ